MSAIGWLDLLALMGKWFALVLFLLVVLGMVAAGLRTVYDIVRGRGQHGGAGGTTEPDPVLADPAQERLVERSTSEER